MPVAPSSARPEASAAPATRQLACSPDVPATNAPSGWALLPPVVSLAGCRPLVCGCTFACPSGVMFWFPCPPHLTVPAATPVCYLHSPSFVSTAPPRTMHLAAPGIHLGGEECAIAVRRICMSHDITRQLSHRNACLDRVRAGGARYPRRPRQPLLPLHMHTPWPCARASFLEPGRWALSHYD